MKKNYLFLFSALLIFNAATLFGQAVTNSNTGLIYSSIQAAIDATETLNGHTLTVAAGVYIENVVVNKELTINGPKAGIDGNDASRGTGEAIVYTAISDVGDGNLNGAKVFHILADNVTIDGFTIDGANPSFSAGPGVIANGFTINAQAGVFAFSGDGTPESPAEAKDNLVIKNNVVKNFYWYGIIFGNSVYSPNAKYSQILHNKIQNVPFQSGIDLNRNYYATVEFNTLMDCRFGINLYYYFLIPQAGKSGSVANNNITTKTQVAAGEGTFTNVKGINIDFHGGLHNDIVWSINENIINNTTTRSADSRGINCSTNWNPTSFTINNNTIAGFESGYSVRNSDATKILTITGGTVTNCTNGVLATNLSEYFGSAQSSVYNINQVTISNNTNSGIFVNDRSSENTNVSSVTVNVNNCRIYSSVNSIKLSGTYAYAAANNNDLSESDTYLAINNISPNIVNATCNWFGQWTGPKAPDNSAGQGSKVSANVTYDPWLVYGADNNPSQAGFQPIPGSCVSIRCGNNENKYFFCHNGSTKCFGTKDTANHLAHGDPFGACVTPPITNASNIAPETVITQRLKLSNMPNPFTNSTILRYELPSDAKVVIKVYDAMGKEVANISAGEKKAGVYTQHFNASRLSSGIYYYKLTAITKESEIVQSGKMIMQ